MEKFMEKQQTIAKRVSLNGIALHPGVRATLTLNPAEENTGIKKAISAIICLKNLILLS